MSERAIFFRRETKRRLWEECNTDGKNVLDAWWIFRHEPTFGISVHKYDKKGCKAEGGNGNDDDDDGGENGGASFAFVQTDWPKAVFATFVFFLAVL